MNAHPGGYDIIDSNSMIGIRYEKSLHGIVSRLTITLFVV